MSQNFSGTRNIISFLLIAGTLLLLVYISFNPNEDKQQTIRIGINQWPGYEYLFIAKKQGFFKQADINIELVELGSLAEVRRAFEREKVDGMAATIIEILEAYKYSGNIAQPILITDYSNGADEILGSSKITTIKELLGRKIGVEAGSLSTYLVNRALKINNINSSEVVMIPMKTHAMTSALKTGKVDAITSYPPLSTLIKKELTVNILFNSSSIPNEILDLVAINQKTLAKHPELQKKFIKAWKFTLDYVAKHPDESYSILTERLPMSIEEFKQSMKQIYLVNAEEQQSYFNGHGILKENLIKTGEIVFMHFDNKEIDYSQFIYDEHFN